MTIEGGNYMPEQKRTNRLSFEESPFEYLTNDVIINAFDTNDRYFQSTYSIVLDRYARGNYTEIDAYFDLLNGVEMGGSLESMYDEGIELLGREEELYTLTILMNRRKTRTALLLGDAGTGKTALAEEWHQRQVAKGENIYMYSLNIGMLGSGNSAGRDEKSLMISRLETMVDRLGNFEKFIQQFEPDAQLVLFIDEVHKVVSTFGAGDKVGGDTLKRSLGRGGIRIIAATTRLEYDQYIASDGPLARRFKNLELTELSFEHNVSILKSWNKSYYPDDEQLDPELNEEANAVYEHIVRSNKLYRETQAEPSASLDVLETVMSYRVTDPDQFPFNISLANKAFREMYDIELDFSANYDQIFSTLENRVKGQPMMLWSLDRVIKRMMYPLEPSSRPRATMLMVGSSGTGKTETVKSLAEGMYGDETNIINISMTDYSEEGSGTSFRTRLGTAIFHQPSSIILFDELEKASTEVQLLLLPILDEGVVTYPVVSRDGSRTDRQVSLRNTIVVATSNAGADLFADQAKYARRPISSGNVNEYGEELETHWRKSEAQLHEALQHEGFRPELLGRFRDGIIPYAALPTEVSIEIVEAQIAKMIQLFEEIYNVEIQLPPRRNYAKYGYDYDIDGITGYVVITRRNESDSNDGGARRLLRTIDQDVRGAITNAIADNPGTTSFALKTNGKNVFESEGESPDAGRIEAVPTMRSYSDIQRNDEFDSHKKSARTYGINLN